MPSRRSTRRNASSYWAAGLALSLVLLPQTCNLVIQAPDKDIAALGKGAVRTSVCLPDGREVWAYPQISVPGSKAKGKKEEEEEQQKDKDKSFCAFFWALRLVHENDLEEAQVPLEESEVSVSLSGKMIRLELGMNEDTQAEEDEVPGAERLDFVRLPILTNLRDVQAGDELVRKQTVCVEKTAKPVKIKASSISGQPKKKKAKTVEVGDH